MKTVHIEASGSYDVLIGGGILDGVGDAAKSTVPCGKAVIVSGERVFPLYGERLTKSLENAGFEVLSFIHESGEGAKSLDTYGRLVNFLCENKICRDDTLFALGGGVTGDLAGFAAATYRRGMDYIQIPTTLLAAADSSVGGKTAINLPAGKNQLGAFYQPRAVFCDTDTLATLPPEEYRAGCAEVIKYAVLCGGDFFSALETRDRLDTESVIAKCVSVKRDIVEKDEFDTGERMLLNLGHTAGHAIERCSGYTVSHGDAVAIGLARICTAAAKKGILPDGDCGRIIAVLKKYSLPVSCDFSADALLDAAMSDKKASGGRLRLIVPERIGSCRIITVDAEELRTWIV